MTLASSAFTMLICLQYRPQTYTKLTYCTKFFFKIFSAQTSGLYYKPIMIVNDNSRVINKLETSLTNDAGVIIYERHIFIVQATADLKIRNSLILLHNYGY